MSHRIALVCALAVTGCGASTQVPTTNLGFEIACDADPCGWEAVEGTYRWAGTWHTADPGLDFSATTHAIVEQRTTFQMPNERDYVLEATALREGEAVLVLELHWYRAIGDRPPPGYWDQQPALVRIDRYKVEATGLHRFRTLTSVPSEVGGLALRVVKDGPGRAWLDELSYRPLSAAREN
jgi:hypothetical protein